MPSTPAAAPPVVVVLTGGASRRMGSHKPLLDVGGRPLVARVLDAAGDRPTLVVGPGQGVPEGVRVVMEPVPGGGPVSGVATALATLLADARAADGTAADGTAADDPPSGTPLPYAVVLLAADLPFVTPDHVERLVAALASADLAVTVDPTDRVNWLCAAWRTDVLGRRLEVLEDPYGRSMRELADGVPRVSVTDHDRVALDVDTPADLERARRRAAGDPDA